MTPMLPMINVTPKRGPYALDRRPRTALERAVLAAQAEALAERRAAWRRRLRRALRRPFAGGEGAPAARHPAHPERAARAARPV